jgi:hypothetical protein
MRGGTLIGSSLTELRTKASEAHEDKEAEEPRTRSTNRAVGTEGVRVKEKGKEGQAAPVPVGCYAASSTRREVISEHQWLSRRVRCKDCDCKGACGCERYLYGRITVVSRIQGRMSYKVKWDEEDVEDEEYDYRVTQSLLLKEDESSDEEDDMPISRWCNVAADAESVNSSSEEEEELEEEEEDDRSKASVERPTLKVELRYSKSENGSARLSTFGRKRLGVGRILKIEAGVLEEEVDSGGPASDSEESDSDDEVDDIDGGGATSYRGKAKEFLTKSLRKKTRAKYKSAMSAFKEYLLLEDLSLTSLEWDPAIHDETTKSCQAEELFMGFVWYLVEERGVKVKTASSYSTNVKTQIGTASGIDLKYGRDWSRMRRLIGRLKDKYGDTKRVRLPLLQQHLEKIWDVMDALDSGLLRRSAQYEELSKSTKKLGVNQCKALLATQFFGANRGRDVLPESAKDFDDSEDCTVEDLEWTHYGHALRIKRTKVGKNEEFNAKPYARIEGCKICPAVAMKHYLKDARADGRHALGREKTTPLFCTKDGTSITTRDLYTLVKGCCEAVGLDKKKYATHSLRIGGVTAALACNLGNERVCSLLGYWVKDSDAMKVYLRPTEENLIALLREMGNKKHTAAMQLSE